MNKAKSILKRSLAILLAVLTLMSVGLTSVIALSIDMAQTAGYTTLAETGAGVTTGQTIWFKKNRTMQQVYIHAWSDSSGTTWPGERMNYNSDLDMYYWVSNGNYTKCLFHDGDDGCKSSDQALDNTKLFFTQNSSSNYNGTWSSYTYDKTYIGSTLLSVLKNEKIMFYIGEPVYWNQYTFYLGNDSGSVTSGKSVIKWGTGNTSDSHQGYVRMTVVAAPAGVEYKVSHSSSFSQHEIITGGPKSGIGYICNTDNNSTSISTYGSEYSVAASLESTEVVSGTDVKVTVNKSNGNFNNTNTTVDYYYTVDGNNFTYLSLNSNGTLDTSELETGKYEIYPVLKDAYGVYTRGNKMELTIKKAANGITVTEKTDNGTVSIDGAADGNTAEVDPGADTTITITPNTGYKVSKVEGVTSGITYNDDYSATVEITNISEDVNLTVTYEKLKYEITFKYGLDGLTTKKVETEHGVAPTAPTSEAQVTGYTLTGWTPTISEATGTATYTAQYSINKYTFKITGFDPEKATMTVDGVAVDTSGEFTKQVEYGGNIAVVVTPKDAYNLSVDGSPVNSYNETITMGADNKTIALGFDIKTFDLTINQNINGTVTVDGKDFTANKTQTLNYNRYTINVTAPEHYYISSVTGVEDPYTYTEGDEKKEFSTFEVVLHNDATVVITYAEMDKFDLTVQQSGYVESYTDGHKIMIDDDETGAITVSPVQDHIFELYGGSHKIYVCAPFNHYIKSLTVGGNVIDDLSIYHKNTDTNINFYEIEYNFTLSDDLTIIVEYAYNPTVTIDTVQDGVTTNLADDTIGYGNPYSIDIEAPDGYYISAVEGLDAHKPATDKEYNYTSFTFEVDSLEADVNSTVTFTKIPEYTISFSADGVAGGTVTNANGNVVTSPVTVRWGTNYTLNFQAPKGYYISEFNGAVLGQDFSHTTESITFEDIRENKTVTIKYAAIPTLKIEVTNTPAAGGTVTVKDTSGNNVNLNAVPYGTVVNVTAKANTGYTLGSLVIDDETITGATHQITVEDNVNITATWAEKTDVEFILRAPSSKGSATGTVNGSLVVDTDSSNAIPNKTDIEKNTTITLTAAGKTGANQTFDKWVIDGKYTIAEDDSLTDEEIVITVNGPTTATATFKTDKKYIYIYNGAPTTYSNLKVKVQDVNNSDFFTPTTTVTIGDKTYYKIEITDSTSYVNIKDGGNTENFIDTKYDKNGVYNCYNITGAQKGEWATISEGGSATNTYTIQTSDGNNSVQLEDYGDGLYVGDLTLEGVTEASVYIKESSGTKWGVDGTQPEGNSTSVKSGSNINVYINFVDTNTYTLGFTFDPKGTLSWTIAAKPETVEIEFFDGAESRGDVDVINNFWPNSKSMSSDGRTLTVEVYKNEYVTLETELTSSNYTNYKVLGWVIDGTNFAPARADEDGKVFTGEYNQFKDGDIVVPVYAHTQAWYDANPTVDTVRVYFQKDTLYVQDQGDNWGPWVAAYTWYTTGEKFYGVYPGQLLIPMGNGEYYTDIETSNADNGTILGVTFNNYMKTHPKGTYPTPVDGNNYQTYDYYDFVALNDSDEDYNTITYVLKAQNYDSTSKKNVDNGNITRYTSSANTFLGDSTKIKTFRQVYYNISHDAIDISRTETTTKRENIASGLTSGDITPALYIVRQGHKNDGKGQYSVECLFYDSNKYYIGSCYSYQLHDLDYLKTELDIDANSDTYKDKPVVVYYEGYTYQGSDINNRVDGEWFGLTADTDFDLDVKMTLRDENGNYSDFVTESDYGKIQIHNNSTTATLPVNSETDIQATVTGPYKFMGWYHTNVKADGSLEIGELLSTSSISTVQVSKNATYIAVFEPLGEGTLLINHDTYVGSPGDSAAPVAHSKNADAFSKRWIKVEWVDENDNVIAERDAVEQQNSVLVDIQEFERLKITIRTELVDPTDWLFAWYTDSSDLTGKNSFEEIGMKREFTEELDQGQTQEFSFIYEVKEEEETSTSRAATSQTINIYSDIVHTDMDVKLIYKYVNRFGENKNYVVNYTLQNLEGFNERSKKHPSPQTIADNAPYVDDIFKNVTWVITDEKIGVGTTFTLEAKYNNNFTVTIYHNGSEPQAFVREFNDVIELHAEDFGYTNNNGFWYKETGQNGEYTVNEDIILGYGRYYGLRVTDDMTVCYQPLKDGQTILNYLGYQVVLDEAIYGREQTSDGNTSLDKIFVDYLVNLHLPYFYGDDVPGKENEKFNDDFNADSPITMDTFIKQTGYTVDYGVMLQMVNPNKTDTLLDKEVDIEAMKELIAQGKGGDTNDEDVYYSLYSAAPKEGEESVLTNKNRFIETFISGTTDKDKRRKYNVYAYLVVKDKDGKVIKDSNGEDLLFISNRQTLNVEEYLDDEAKLLEGIINKQY